MVGGRIVSVEDQGDRLRVIVADAPYGRHEFCGVEVAKTPHRLALGDSLWWQGRHCYWTPAGEKPAWDVPIPRLGYSFSTGFDGGA